MHKRPSQEVHGDGTKRTKMSQSIPQNHLEPNTPDNLTSSVNQESETPPSENSDSESASSSDSETSSESEYSSGSEQAGIIQRISLKNFMCHDSFELDLGPRLNFIIGRNGSGKSAVITGIAVGLGAKASVTSRGSSLLDLIKDGKSVAKISITFRNEGRDAYHREKLGSSITIERRLVRSGAGTYAIKDSRNKTFSTKKAVIDEILLKYNIRVDNPLSFLSQDKAREFLTSTNDEEKYKYFMQGILVDDIIENYKKIETNMKNMSEELRSAKTFERAAKKKFQEASETYEKFRQSDRLRQRLELLGGKIFWYNTTQIERLMNKRQKEMKGYQNSIDEINDDIQKKTELKEASVESKSTLEQQAVEELNTVEELTNARDALAPERSRKRNDYDRIASEIKSNQNDIEESETKISDLEQKLQREIEKAENDDSDPAKRIEKLTAEIEDIKKAIKDSRKRMMKYDGKVSDTEEYIQVQQKINQCHENCKQLNKKLESLVTSKKDKYSAWRGNVGKLVEEIRSINSWHEKPLGPIGSYINVKSQYSSWKDLLNATLNKSLDSYLVCDEHDRKLLLNLMKKHHVNASIITRKFESFDYTVGKVSTHTSFVDMLNVSNDQILYTLIDMNNIEKSIINVDNSRETDLIKVPNVLYVYSKVSPYSGRRTSGNAGSIANDPVSYNTNAPYKFSENQTEIEDEIKSTKSRLQEEQKQILQLNREKKTVSDNFILQKNDAKKELQELQQQRKELEEELNDWRLKESGELNPILLIRSEISELTSNISRCKNISLSLADDFKKAREDYKTINAQYQDYEKRISELNLSIVSKKSEAKSLGDQIISIDVAITKNNNAREKIQLLVNSCQQKLDDLIPKLEENKSKAEAICERSAVKITDSDTSQSIQAEYQSTQKSVEEAEQAVGITLEDAQERYLTTQKIAEETENTVLELENTHNKLETEFGLRLKYLRQTLDNNVLDARNLFEEALDVRGFKGKLVINMQEKKVIMLVAPQAASEMRTIDSLSGGEKSFTQVAFLLSIWLIMKSKIRGLDEFDVFMDSVNRTISIKLLLEELKKSPDSQTIFITPQDITTIGNLTSSDVKIHKISSPRND